MTIEVLFPVVLGYIACVSLLISIKFREKKIVSSAGKCHLQLFRGTLTKVYFLMAVCVILISVVLLNRLPKLGNYVICAVSVLGFEIAIRNFLLTKYCGVYENGAFLQYPFVLYENIESIPVLGWDDKDSVLDGQLNLNIVLKDGNNITFMFSSEQEMQQVISLMIDLCPRLKK